MTTPTRNGAVLTAHEATIHTTQVEIQVLKVGRKQVTMGLFRQLPLRTITLPHDTTFFGEPWGHVHYWWEGDGRQPVVYAGGGLVDMTALHIV